MRWRLLDTGLRSAAENIALDMALLEAQQAGASPPTLRFLRFTPSALLGFHQHPRDALDLEACRALGVEVQRRITGGGAIYFEPAHLGWEVLARRSHLGIAPMAEVTARLCQAAAKGLRSLGIPARFRPRNDIEVEGKKISGTGGAFEGEALLFQGTLLLDLDVETMLRVLRVPAEKLTPRAIASVAERITTVRALLGTVPPLEEVKAALAASFAEALGAAFEARGLLPAEEEGFARALAEVRDPAWVFGEEAPRGAGLRRGIHRAPGGTIQADVLLEGHRLGQVWFSGDFFVTPKRLIPDLEAALRGVPLKELEHTLLAFFEAHPAEMLALEPRDFLAALEKALAG